MPPRKRFAAYQILEESSHAKHWKSRRKNEWIKFCRSNWKERPTPWGEQPPEWLIPRVHPGDYMYNDNTVEGFVMSRQGDGGPHWSTVWRALFECPILECPIGGPYWRALSRALHVVHSLENSRGPNLKGKQNSPEGEPLSSKMSPRTESSRPLLVLFSTMCSFEHVFQVNTSTLLDFCPLGPELDLI